MLLDEPGRAAVPPRSRCEHCVEPGIFKARIPRPVNTGRPAEEQARGALAPHASNEVRNETRWDVREPEQPKTRAACFREADQPVDPPRRQLARSKGIVEAGGHGLEAELSLARVYDVGRARPVEPVRSRARHCAFGGDAIENDIQKQREPGLAADRGQLLDCRVCIAARFQCGIGSLEIVR